MLAELLSAFYEAFCEMALLIWQQMGFRRGLAVGLLAVAILLTACAGAVTYVVWRQNVRAGNENFTNQLLERHANELAGNRDEQGLFVRYPRKTLPVEDAWGNELRVQYSQSPLHDVVMVWSQGADERENTFDDLSVCKRVVRPKAGAAKLVLDKAKQAIQAKLLPND